MNSDEKLVKDHILAMACFCCAVQQRHEAGAARFREEMHSIMDLQLDNLMKQVKRHG